MKNLIIVILTLGLGVAGVSYLSPNTHTEDKRAKEAAVTIIVNKTNDMPEVVLDNKIDDTPDLIENEKIDYLKDTTSTDKDGNLIINNTEDVLVLVNKNRNLPSNHKPTDLVIPNIRFSFKENLEKKYLRKEAADALEELFIQAKEDKIILYGVSGYRSYATQKMLFDNKSNKVGAEKANLLVAMPGQSEHQTGLAIDVSCESVGFSLSERFGQAIEGKWVKDNAHLFGFIIRYQKDTTEITGYSYEPWHIRYVGKEVAKEIYENNITLEEFLGDI